MNELYCNEHLDISSTLNLKRHKTNKLICKCCGKKFSKQSQNGTQKVHGIFPKLG